MLLISALCICYIWFLAVVSIFFSLLLFCFAKTIVRNALRHYEIFSLKMRICVFHFIVAFFLFLFLLAFVVIVVVVVVVVNALLCKRSEFYFLVVCLYSGSFKRVLFALNTQLPSRRLLLLLFFLFGVWFFSTLISIPVWLRYWCWPSLDLTNIEIICCHSVHMKNAVVTANG